MHSNNNRTDNSLTWLFATPVVIPIAGELVMRMQEVVGDHFVGDLSGETNDEFRERTARAQRAINRRVTPEAIVESLHCFGPNMMVQGEMYLRAQRPELDHQAVGWHRESMYGCPKEAFNVWVPVLNCTPENSVRYIPGSAAIPDDELGIHREMAGAVKKGSAGHRIGLLYAPKVIDRGVDFAKAVTMDVPLGSAVVFDSELIHGAAVNNTNKIRFSCDFRVIASEFVAANKSHFDGTYWR